ncbi:hypothetical protein B9Z55_007944 [Caenorhabditis nigoni]|uniref:Uncharacterized protein n=1 Tax=Caenorhabditis nigoni TaxID=1611254 RepID=A0A2G5VC01_9PELO|nr:hypothetical protein B9Z55_007944 [Caenorhabditis nigoni]
MDQMTILRSEQPQKILALSGKNGTKTGPAVPSSDHRSQKLRQRSNCFDNGPIVPMTVPTFRQRSQGYDNGPSQAYSENPIPEIQQKEKGI